MLWHCGHLRSQAYEVLKHLAENKGRLVSKDSLIETVWRERAVTDDALVQCLMEVRHALGEKGKRYVRNVRGRGYIFDSEENEPQKLEGGSKWTGQGDLLRTVVEEEKEEVDPAGETDRGASQPAGPAPRAATAAAIAEASAARMASSAVNAAGEIQRHQRAAIISLTALALAAAVVVYFTRFAPGGQAIRSVAVLPFSNESGDPNLEYLSDGLSESLIDRLSQLPGVKVIARSSSFKYKGKEVDPQEAAKTLGVEALVMGRVVQRGDDLQVRAELVDTREGTQMWGDQYSPRTADIQALQEEMARTISEKLRLRLSSAQEQQFAKHATQHSQAYQFYLNGLFHLRKGGVENARRALGDFNQAVALDPNFALAWVGVAHANRYFSGNSVLDPKEPLARAKATTQKALGLDETLAEAHVELAGIKRDEWDWAGAEREYKGAIELNPNLVEARTWYSGYLSAMGRHTEALAENRRAQELDPLRTGLIALEGWLLNLARRHDEAGEKLRQLIKMEPDGGSARRINLGLVYEAKGMDEQAIDEYRKAFNINEEMAWRQIILGYALAMSGKRSDAQAILDKLKTTKE